MAEQYEILKYPAWTSLLVEQILSQLFHCDKDYKPTSFE